MPTHRLVHVKFSMDNLHPPRDHSVPLIDLVHDGVVSMVEDRSPQTRYGEVKVERRVDWRGDIDYKDSRWVQVDQRMK